MDIRITTNGQPDCSRVLVKIDSELNCTERFIVFEIDTGEPYIAELMVKHLNKLLQNSVKRLIQKSYELGWSDKKSHKARRTCFNDRLDAETLAWLI